jgi:hypothetical protein
MNDKTTKTITIRMSVSEHELVLASCDLVRADTGYDLRPNDAYLALLRKGIEALSADHDGGDDGAAPSE